MDLETGVRGGYLPKEAYIPAPPLWLEGVLESCQAPAGSPRSGQLEMVLTKGPQASPAFSQAGENALSHGIFAKICIQVAF